MMLLAPRDIKTGNIFLTAAGDVQVSGTLESLSGEAHDSLQAVATCVPPPGG